MSRGVRFYLDRESGTWGCAEEFMLVTADTQEATDDLFVAAEEGEEAVEDWFDTQGNAIEAAVNMARLLMAEQAGKLTEEDKATWGADMVARFLATWYEEPQDDEILLDT